MKEPLTQLKIEVTPELKASIVEAARNKEQSIKDYITNLHLSNIEENCLSNSECKLQIIRSFVHFQNMNEDLRINRPDVNRSELEKGLECYATLEKHL